MAGPNSKVYKGWWNDSENARGGLYYGTGGASDPVEVIRVTGSAITFLQQVTASGFDTVIADTYGMIIGSATQVTISDGDGATNLIPELQVLGTAAADGSLLVASFNTTNTRAVSPHIALVKGAAATQVATTAVADNEVVGSIIAYGSDSADFETPVAAIEFVVDDVGAPGAGAIGGSLEFSTTADGGETLTLAFTINNDQNIYVANNNGMVIGHTAQVNIGEFTHELQVLGTTDTDGGVGVGTWSTSASQPARINLFKSKSGTIGTLGIVAVSDQVGEIRFAVDDGVDNSSLAATIRVTVDATPSAGSSPGRIGFFTAPIGFDTASERLRIASTGLITFQAGTTPASVATSPGTNSAGEITATGGLGGNTTIGTTGTAGNGGGYSFTGGAGGVASAATTAATGGVGGVFTVTTGAGGAEAVAGVNATGGASGVITLLSGDGGAVSAAVSGTATGGNAGLVTIRGGVGGAVTATTGTNVGGNGAGVSIIGGAGGAASGATDTGGNGGVITITPGGGGTGDTNGAPGYIVRTAGITRRQIQTIDMADGAVTLTLVPGTPTGTLMTSDILYVDANSTGTENLLLPPEADLTGVILVIVNTGGETINILNDASGAVLTLETANTAIVTCDGTTLRGVVVLP